MQELSRVRRHTTIKRLSHISFVFSISRNEYYRRDRLQKQWLHVTIALSPTSIHWTSCRGTPWRSNSTEDALAVERHAAFQLGLFANPIYTTGDWPDIVKQTLSAEYLPRFTDEEKSDLLGSADFFAIDAYHSLWVKAPDEGIDACIANPSHHLWPICNEPVYFDSDYGWPEGPAGDPAATSLQTTPVAIRALLKEIYTRWPSDKMVSCFFFNHNCFWLLVDSISRSSAA